MGKLLAKSYVYSIIAFVIGLFLIWASAQDTEGKSMGQIQAEKWRISMYAMGLLFIVLAIVGDIILNMIFEYKILGLK